MQIIKKIGGILVNKAGEVLIFKEKLDGKKEGYNIPKGTYNENLDKTLGLGLVREIYEETNLKNIEIKDVFNIYPKYYDDCISLLIIFLVKVNNFSEISNKNIGGDEFIYYYKWINRKDFIKLSTDDFVDKRIYEILKDYFDLL